MKRELSDLVAYVERIRYAFYVVGKPAAVKEAMASGHGSFAAARSALAAIEAEPDTSIFAHEWTAEEILAREG